ncbi:MAG: helix-turn-helix transcriptional regulator [Planctomycetes bacterium]|nr:helix-turn-helix transcriptional regulator [Planctomycetota bacterium]
MSLVEKVVSNIRRACKEKNISQRELSRRSGVGHVTICRILSGQQSPSLETCDAIAAALRVSAERFFTKTS